MSAFTAQRELRARRRVGTVLGGKYTLVRVLGAGGMAAVYEGVHRNGHRVAVKILHDDASEDPRTVTRFRREGYVANSLGHPGAVRVLDDDVDADGAAYLVMELLEGETLYTRAKRSGGHLPVREVLAVARELMGVLAAAHDKGVVHRDVKPENLFLTTDRALKVLDFGIARGADGPDGRATHAGAALGTPAFMPPEQALGHSRDVDARSDLWSAGATMFALISGVLVHEAETASELLVAAATRHARSLREVAPGAPAPVIALVDRALQFRREDRWPSAAALRDAIDEAHLAAFGEPVSSSSIGPVTAAHPPAPGPTAELFYAETKVATAPSLSPVSTTDVGPARPLTEKPTGPPLSEASPEASPTLADPPASTAGTLPSRLSPTQPSAPDEPPALRPTAPRGRRILAAALAFVVGFALVMTRMHAPATLPSSSASAAATPAAPRRDPRVPLASEDCKVLAAPGDVDNEATVWIGAMFPLTGPDAALNGAASMDSVDLARRDFAETVGGLPPARPGGPRRPLAVIACDDSRDPVRAASHLAGDLHVPAIVGFYRSKEVADLAASHFTPGGVLALASNTASMLRTIPHPAGQPRLVFRTTTSSDMVKAPLGALLAQVIEPDLRAQPGLLAPGEPIRVALVRIDNATGLGVADGLVSTLRYNGKSVAENGDAFRQIVLADLPDEARMLAEIGRVAVEVAAYAPHVVLGVKGSDSLILDVERAWPSSARFRPRYLGVSWNRVLADHVLAHPDLRRRLFDVDTVTRTAVMAKFVQRHNEVFASKVTAESATPAPYDAFYAAAYAIAALGPEPVTGPALARVMPRILPPGEPIDVGPAGIFAALAALESGKNIDLQGAVTSLDFDLATGDATADFAVFCIAPGKDGEAPAPVESGLVFRARERKLEGTLRCP